MASESARDLRGVAVEELQNKEKSLREEIFNLRFKKASGEVGNTARVKTAKRELSRIMTVLREKRNV